MNATVNTVCYKWKTLSNGEHPLMIRVCKDGKKKYLSLGISVNPIYWDFQKNKPKANCPNKEYINKIIADKENDFTEQIVQLKSERKDFTANGLVDNSAKKVQPKTVNDVFLEQLQRLTDENRRGYMLSVRQVYNSLIEFNKHLDIYFPDIDVTWCKHKQLPTMIGKISKGATFHGCVKYAMGKDEAKLLVAEGILIGTVKDISDSFEMQRAMRPTIKQPVGHIALSYKPEDTPRLTDKVMVGLAHEYMKEMGIKITQYIIVRHHNTDNPHVHLIYNKVDFDGKLISSHNDFKRNEIATKKIKEKYRLTFGEGKEQVNRQKLNDPDKTKYDIYHAVKGALKTAHNWDEFQQQLRNKGIEMTFKYKGQTSEVQGISFTKDGLSYKGSQVDRSFSFSKLDAQLSQTNHQEQPKQVFIPQTQQPQVYELTNSESAIGGLFDIPFIPNGTDPEEEEFRKRMQRKKKKGIRR